MAGETGRLAGTALNAHPRQAEAPVGWRVCSQSGVLRHEPAFRGPEPHGSPLGICVHAIITWMASGFVATLHTSAAHVLLQSLYILIT